MSNLIKSHYINLNQEGKLVGMGNGFQPLASSAATIYMEEDTFESSDPFLGNGFSEGLDVANMQRLVEEEEELITEKAERLLIDANEAAEKIIEDARAEAEAMKAHAIEEGKKSGYLDGFEQGQAELKKMELQLEDEKDRLEEEYHQKEAELEPKFATVMIHLLEKLTGVVVNDHKEVILHLIHQGMSEVEKSKNFVIKVSTEEYRMVLEHKEQLLQGLPDDVELYIREEEEFAKNQCLIEADGKMIDCSLDVQLKGLMTDLKLLACI